MISAAFCKLYLFIYYVSESNLNSSWLLCCPNANQKYGLLLSCIYLKNSAFVRPNLFCKSFQGTHLLPFIKSWTISIVLCLHVNQLNGTFRRAIQGLFIFFFFFGIDIGSLKILFLHVAAKFFTMKLTECILWKYIWKEVLGIDVFNINPSLFCCVCKYMA